MLPTKWAVPYHKAHAADKDVIDSSTFNAVLSSLRPELESRERANAGNEQVPPKPSRGHLPRDKHSDYAKEKGSAASLKVGSHYVKSRFPLCDSERHEAGECNATILMEEKKKQASARRKVFPLREERTHDARVLELVSPLREMWPSSYYSTLRPSRTAS